DMENCPQYNAWDREQQLEQLDENDQLTFSFNTFPFGYWKNGTIPGIICFPGIEKRNIRSQASKHENNSIRICRNYHEASKTSKDKGCGMCGQHQFFIEQFHPNSSLPYEA